jgi:hypothetical protein
MLPPAIQQAATDQLQRIKTVELSARFQKMYIRTKAYIYIYASRANFEFKKQLRVFLMCPRFKKNQP